MYIHIYIYIDHQPRLLSSWYVSMHRTTSQFVMQCDLLAVCVHVYAVHVRVGRKSLHIYTLIYILVGEGWRIVGCAANRLR